MKRSRSLLIFYLLGAYVFLQFIWWAYMLVDLNREIYELKLQILELTLSSSPEIQIQKGELDKKLYQRMWMVLGEGSVFFVLLVYGAWKTHQSFKKEMQLANQQRNFLLSITHELKSPISSIKLYLQTLMKRELGREQQLKIATSALKDTERLSTLVENLLLATKVERVDFELHREKLNLSELVQELVAASNFPENRVQLQVEDSVELVADRLAISSIITNLIENAIKYSPEESTVTVELEKEGGQVIFKVKDQGAGIPDAEKSRVFNKFYRVGSEETRKTKGTGLGLYIVKELVDKLGGSVRVKDNHPAGSIFEVSF